MHHCECPTARVQVFSDFWYRDEETMEARNHAAGECAGTYDIRRYNRDGTLLWLCSCCTYDTDKEVDA
jgi:hypothetical protein